MPREEARKALSARRSEKADFEIFPENWLALNVFLACATQWRIVEKSFWGLDYPSVEAVMRIHRVKDKRDTFEKVRVLESAALAEFRKK